MSKTFPYFGTATNNKGEFSVRGAADNVKRVVAMEKAGLSNIVLVALPFAMLKLDACKYILGCTEFQTPGQQAAIKQYIENNDELYLPLEPVVTTPADVVFTGVDGADDVVFTAPAETPAVVAETTEEEAEVSDTVYDNKIVDLGDEDDFEQYDHMADYGFTNYAE